MKRRPVRIQSIWGGRSGNRGYARELIRASFSLAADLLGAREMVNYVKLDNTPSVRVQESLGFRLDHVEYYDNCPSGLGIFRRL